MTIKITCPHCAQKFEASGEVVGTVISCCTCSKPFHVGRREATKHLKIGTYQGTCTDKTGENPVVSRLTLTIIRQENEVVHGKVRVTGDLDADLDFNGTIDGNYISFVTSTPDSKLTIDWSAEIQNDCLLGNFKSIDTGFWSNLFWSSTNNQQGEWQCKKERFPLIGRVKKFTTRAFWTLVIVSIICALIASEKSSPSRSSYYPTGQPIISSASNSDLIQSTAVLNQPRFETSPQYSFSPETSNLTSEYKPRVSTELIGSAAEKTYNYVLDQKRVDVSGYVRDNTYVNSYTRQPPGGVTFDDKLEAAGWASAVAAGIFAVDWVDQKLEQRKRNKEWPYSSNK